MRALRSFAVRASLPEPLRILHAIALNLRWSWDPKGVDLFRWVDADAWERAGHDPERMLGLVPRGRFDELIDDGPFMAFLASVSEDLRRYTQEDRWYQRRRDAKPLGTVAYFSPEFGVCEALPTYSGGLGVLAGDHLKAASDLGLPLVGLGLFYRQGYFRQRLNSDGWQVEHYPELDPHGMPLTLVASGDGDPLRIDVDLAGARCAAQIWCAEVGRVRLFLLDCDIEENDERERIITDRLYAGGSEHRLRQEIVLGIGGVRALSALGYEPDVFHSNEGHAGFLGLERIRRLVTLGGLSFKEALEAVRATTIFTTHTPVPAGIDIYEPDLMRTYFEPFAKECGVQFEELMALGRVFPQEGEPDGAPFNMAVMGFHLSGRANAVSKLHAHVSRGLFSELWPSLPREEAPIGSITNGVHVSTWLGPEMAEVFDRRLSPGWAESGNTRWQRALDGIPDAELWRARERARERLVYVVRERLRAQLLARGASEAETAWTEGVFDPGVLTIGFARRFAQYKRATMMLSDSERLKRLLLSSERPVQIVVSGKAHPRDDGGKEMIRTLVHFAGDPEVRERFVVIEDYDMAVARVLTQGCDVWLNNPRRPLEACGTSGMKAALNGALNCSVLDGWWDECYDGRNGWAIGTREILEDVEAQDRLDGTSLYNLLEREVAPRFYDRSEGPVPRRWIERLKHSISTLAGYVSADRMLRDYVQQLYEPAAEQGRALRDEDFRRARELAAWKQRVQEQWSDVSIIDVQGDITPAAVGEDRTVEASVRFGRLSPEDLSAQLIHGRVGANGELLESSVVRMALADHFDGAARFRGSFTAVAAGLYGFTVRILPSHRDLTSEIDMGLITVA